MKADIPGRHTYQVSCELLQELGYLEKGDLPAIPGHRPQHDDEQLGVSFFRTFVDEGELENMTLPRTYCAKTEVGPVSFKNTDLTESTLCWNDFNEVDFTDADLSRSDLRSSNFKGVAFVRALLQGVDLRRSSFKDCDFTGADLRGVKLTRDQCEDLSLSERQHREIDWQDSDGDEPPGG